MVRGQVIDDSLVPLLDPSFGRFDDGLSDSMEGGTSTTKLTGPVLSGRQLGSTLGCIEDVAQEMVFGGRSSTPTSTLGEGTGRVDGRSQTGECCLVCAADAGSTASVGILFVEA